MMWLLLLGLFCILIWYKYVRPLSYWTKKGVKQLSPTIFFGDMWDTVCLKYSINEFAEKLYNIYPNCRYFGIYQYNIPTLVIRDLELIKELTIRHSDHFTDHKFVIDLEADPLWAGTLFALNGKKWREMRAILNGFFTSTKIKHMFVLMEETANNFIQYVLNKNDDFVEMDFRDFFTRYTNDVIVSAALGIEVDSLKDPKNGFYLMGKDVTKLNGLLPGIKIMLNLAMPKILSTLNIGIFSKKMIFFFTNAINQTIKAREEKGIVRPDLINLLLDARKTTKLEDEEDKEEYTQKEANMGKKQLLSITNDDIASQAFVFYTGAFETVATTMCFIAYELALNKDIQDRLREEVKRVSLKNTKLTYDDLSEMKYMDMVISEVLRKWPPVGIQDRVCTKPFTIEPVTPDESPLHLTVGDVIWIPVDGIHKDPAYYPDPDRFDPERFSDENRNNIPSSAYMSFGIGPRNCIGYRFAKTEMTVLLFNLILNFEIVPTKRTDIPLKLKKNMIILEADFWMGFKRIRST